MSDIRVLIACHKAVAVPGDDLYLPLFVGAAGKEDIGFQRDDIGENISLKNPMYCELTGLYWAWKNLRCDYLGLVQYRRYFALRRDRKDPLAAVLTREECERLLEKKTVLLPKKRRYYIETIYSQYSHTFYGDQLDLARELIAEKYPDYVTDFDEVMEMRSAYMFNMFIMSKERADAYAKWLFDILFELEKRYDSSKLDAFNRRWPGRVAERLFNVWLLHMVERGEISLTETGEVPYTYLGEVDLLAKAAGFLKAKFLHQKYTKSF